MSKRRIERDLEDLDSAVLEDLSPDERLQLFLEAVAAENEAWLEKLRETAPVETYTGTDLQYAERGRYAHLFAQEAVYQLHTTLLQFEYLDLMQRSQWIRDSLREEAPSEEALDRAAERADEIKMLFASLYSRYHAYRQFAEAELGVDLETWLSLHPEAGVVVEAVEKAFDDAHWPDLAEEWLQEMVEAEEEDEDVDVTLEDIADIRYEGLVAVWEDAIAEIP